MPFQFQRYLNASQFADQLKSTKAYGNEYVGDSLLEELEQSGLLIPRLRMRIPDSIARRIWMENHDYAKNLFGPIAPDGPSWEAAVDLLNRLQKWDSSMLKPTTHPFDNPQARDLEFLESPIQSPFVPWHEQCVDVSSETYPKLVDDLNMETYYSTWQTLLALEVADAGVQFRLNLADEAVRNDVRRRLNNNESPASRHRYSLDPVRAVRAFADYSPTLDAIVWFAEESNRIFFALTKGKTGRFRLSPQERSVLTQQTKQSAASIANRFVVTLEGVTVLMGYLYERWRHWTRCDKPTSANAYKSVMAKTIDFSRQVFNVNFDELNQVSGGNFDAVWPDWVSEQKKKVSLSLRSWMLESNTVTEIELHKFIDFILEKGLEAFFWRLESFENHCFRGNQFSLGGMRSDLQGMAVAVEHIATTLGGVGSQLYEKFKKLWSDESSVSQLLKDNRSGLYARENVTPGSWLQIKPEIDKLRAIGSSGEIAADLVVASRIRLGAHNPIDEDDQLELEQLFLCLMRAAIASYTYVLRRQKLV